jgi:hypothetical protein
LRAFEKSVPRREVERGDWRKFYNEELHNLCSSPSIIWAEKSNRTLKFVRATRREQSTWKTYAYMGS